MELRVIEDLIVFSGMMATLGCITKVTLAVVRRRRELPDGGATAAILEMAQRLERIEQGVEGTALEIERLAEGQRFTAKLLAERGRPLMAEPARERTVTPH